MSDSEPREPTVRVDRTFRAAPDRVFQAFLDPELIRRWITPGEFVVDSVTVEPKVGGRIRVSHSLNGVSYGGFEGLFLEIEPHRRLVYRWAFVGTEPEKGEYFDSLVTVTLRSIPNGGTLVTVVHERLEDVRERAPQIFAQINWGWNNVFDKLTAALDQP